MSLLVAELKAFLEVRGLVFRMTDNLFEVKFHIRLQTSKLTAKSVGKITKDHVMSKIFSCFFLLMYRTEFYSSVQFQQKTTLQIYQTVETADFEKC